MYKKNNSIMSYKQEGLSVGANGRGYKIVAEYEATTFRTAQSYIRAKTL